LAKTWADIGNDEVNPIAYEAFWPASPYLSHPQRPREQRPFDDAVLHVDELGDDTADITVIVLHGGGGHGRLLLPFAVPLAQAGYRVVVPDLPEHGLSHADGVVTFDRWVRWVSLLVEREHAACHRVVLYGLSLGGTTAWHVAAENQHVVGVIATTLLDMRDADARAATASGPLAANVGAPLAIALPFLLDALPLRAGDVGRMAAMSETSSLVQLLERDARIGGVSMPAAFYRTLMTRTPATAPDAGLLPPLLLVHPGADQWTPVALSQSLYDRWGSPSFTHKSMVVLTGGAHLPLERVPFDELQRTVLAWPW
jgi:alpha-beta hydrolase superfamily lysophospholipase